MFPDPALLPVETLAGGRVSFHLGSKMLEPSVNLFKIPVQAPSGTEPFLLLRNPIRIIYSAAVAANHLLRRACFWAGVRVRLGFGAGSQYSVIVIVLVACFLPGTNVAPFLRTNKAFEGHRFEKGQ
jgi:hypothetical protein